MTFISPHPPKTSSVYASFCSIMAINKRQVYRAEVPFTDSLHLIIVVISVIIIIMPVVVIVVVVVIIIVIKLPIAVAVVKALLLKRMNSGKRERQDI
jgi:hypothetical protein